RVTPSSSARRTARMDSASSTAPQPYGWPSRPQNGPPIAQHPMPSALTGMPLRPRVRVVMVGKIGSWSALERKRALAPQRVLPGRLGSEGETVRGVRPMVDPERVEAVRAELDQLGARHFLDGRATARRLLERMPPLERTAYAAAAADRILRQAEPLPARERPGYLADWRPAVEGVGRVLAGQAAAVRQVATAVARCYLSNSFHSRRHDDPADRVDHAIMASLYTAECLLHGCVD